MAKYTEAQKKSIDKYREHKSRIDISKFTTDEKKQQYMELAAGAGMTLTGYVFYLLDQELEKKAIESD